MSVNEDNSPETTTKQAKGLLSWMSHWSVSVAKWVLLGIMFVLAAAYLDFGKVGHALQQVSAANFFGFLAVLMGSQLLYAYRWHLLAQRALRLPRGRTLYLFRVSMLAEFITIAGPSSLVGATVRIVKLAPDSPRRALLATVTDRMVALVARLLLTVALLPVLGASLLQSPYFSGNRLWMLLVALGLGVLLGALLLRLLWNRPFVQRFREVLREVHSPIWLLVLVTMISGVAHLIFAGGHYLLFRSVADVSLLEVTAIILIAQLGRAVPLSLLGVSLAEGSVVALASLVGVSSEASFVVVVLALAGKYIFALFGFFAELIADGRAFLRTAFSRGTKDSGAAL
jgi:hypothetical protein